MRVVALTLLCLCSGLVSALVPVNCSNTSYAEFYFHWCLDDLECQDNLHLFADDLWQFTEMLNNELLTPMHMTADDMCGVSEPWWEALLRTVNLCYPNHYRDASGLCVLRPGRLEDPDVDLRTGLSGAASPFMLAVIFAVFIWLSVQVLDRWRAALVELRRRDTEAAAASAASANTISPAINPSATLIPLQGRHKFIMPT